MASLTPMMQQYFEVKEQYQDCILFFRLGDFYEMFFDDAITASRELEITLTGRDCGQAERAPMCGVPFHAANSYINKLISKGFKVAICEQVEDPSVAKGLVKRDVIRVVTPGTLVDNMALEDDKNNYIASASIFEGFIGLCVSDVSTGEFSTTEVSSLDLLINELVKYNPTELVVSISIDNEFIHEIKNKFDIYINELDSFVFELEYCTKKIKEHFNVISLDSLGLNNQSEILACGSLLEYLYSTQKVDLQHINHINIYTSSSYMALDPSTRRNLELTETMREKSRKGSLLSILDKTVTSIGSRLIRKWIFEPLIDVHKINLRLNSVSELKNNLLIREELRDVLKKVYDIERLSSRIVYGSVNGRDLIALKNSISVLPTIKSLLMQCDSELLSKLYEKLDLLSDIFELIEISIMDEPPVTIREGGIIKLGFDTKVDNLKNITKDSKSFIAEIENEEKEKTGIKNLKVGYNKVFGYFIELSKSNAHLVPDYYIRKQTISTGERYIIPKLKEIEETLLSAESKLVELEYNIFNDIRLQILEQIKRLQCTCEVVSNVDTLCSLAEVAHSNNYCMPKVNNSDNIEIIDGRHPVVEKMLTNNLFIPNDTYLNHEENRLMIITGPNMAGKV